MPADSAETGSSGHESPGQRYWPGRVGSGQCDRPGVWPGFCSFGTRFIVAFGERICGILCTLYFHIVLFTSSIVTAKDTAGLQYIVLN